MQKLDSLMTPAEVAERLRVSSKTILRLVQDGSLPAIRLKRAIRIPEDVVEEFIKNSLIDPEQKDEIWDDEEKPKKGRFSLQGVIKGGDPIPEEAIDEVIKEWERE